MLNVNKKTWAFSLLILSMIFLVSCSGGPQESDVPTQDPNLIYTQAVETVAAQLTTTALAAPPASPTVPPVVAPTEAVQEMSWPTPSSVAGAGNNTQVAGAGTQAAPALPMANTLVVPAEPTVAPTAADKLLDQANMLSQSPGYGWKVSPGASFDIIWVFENTADEQWDQLYTVRRYQGESFGLESSKYTFDDVASNKIVNKGEATEIKIGGAKAPVGEGTYSSFWRLCNNREDEGKPFQCFYLMQIEIVVAN